MLDMLVKLYDLPPRATAEAAAHALGVTIRRPMPYEMTLVLDLIRREFSVGWADETSAAFHRQPISCLVATEGGQVIGFATYDATARGFFGPTGCCPRIAAAASGRLS